MIRAACIGSLLLAWIGCGGARSQAPPASSSPPSEENACARLCDRLRNCGGAPPSCEANCERDRRRLKPGFTASVVGCAEKELDLNACAPDEDLPTRRASVIALCYSATLNVFAARDRGKSARSVLSAACRRRARCAPEAKVDEGACIPELEEHAQAAVMLLSVARDELVESVATCIDASACDESDPVPRCLQPMAKEPS